MLLLLLLLFKKIDDIPFPQRVSCLLSGRIDAKIIQVRNIMKLSTKKKDKGRDLSTKKKDKGSHAMWFARA